MKPLGHILLLAMLLYMGSAMAQSSVDIIVHDGDSISRSFCQPMTGSLRTPFCTDSSLHACAIIHVPSSSNIIISSNHYGVYSGLDTIEVWDGEPGAEPTLAGRFPGSTVLDYGAFINSGTMTVLFKINSKAVDLFRYYKLNWHIPSSNASTCQGRITIFEATDITSTSALLNWQSSQGSYFYVNYGAGNQFVSGNSLQLDDLTPNTDYSVSILCASDVYDTCCTQTFNFRTKAEPTTVCPDVTDLYSPYCICKYHNEYYSAYTGITGIGVEDYGPRSALSQHTIHTDTAERDSCTGYMLRTVYPGAEASVRLGNRLVQSGSESITYCLRIDTNIYSMLLLHYAAVLQNAGHNSSDNPRFMLEILDSNDHVIDPDCGVIDFIASTELGWTNYLGTLWKDWTAFGLDLTPYHGQEIHVRFSTRDCLQGAHYGYAYFNAEFGHKNATSLHCGDVDSNTLSAPEGFNYRWYYHDPDDYFSTQRTITHETTDTIVHCRLISTENPNCHIDIKTAADRRYPVAEIDTVYISSNHCETYDVQFVNRSHINYYNLDMGDNLEYCDAAKWYFGDGDSSTAFNPVHTYDTDGVYTVTLVASISGEECSDTVTYLLNLPEAYQISETMSVCDSLLWRDGIVYRQNTDGVTYLEITDDGCDSLFYLHLNVRHSSRTLLDSNTICSGQMLSHYNFYLPPDIVLSDTVYYLYDTLTNIEQCDSLVGISVVRRAAKAVTLSVEADCRSKKYLLQATTDDPAPRWYSSPHDPAVDSADGLYEIYTNPETTTLYSVTVAYPDKPYCPVTADTILMPVTLPTAALEVNPEVLSLSNLMVKAFDIGTGYNDRNWTVVNHLSGTSDTVHLATTDPNIRFMANRTIDSLTVILSAFNNICRDSASRTLPMVYSTLWAPNVFTPTRDNNNRFTVYGHGIVEATLTIYNRQGLLVYTTHDLESGWDGTHNGVAVPQAAYVWLLEYRTVERPNSWEKATGEVLLLR